MGEERTRGAEREVEREVELERELAEADEWTDDPALLSQTTKTSGHWSANSVAKREAATRASRARRELATLLFERGVSVKDVADHLGVTPATAGKYRAERERAAKSARGEEAPPILPRLAMPRQCREHHGAPCIARPGMGTIRSFCGRRILGHQKHYRRLADLETSRVLGRLGLPCRECARALDEERST